jgi:hypothetical protein
MIKVRPAPGIERECALWAIAYGVRLVSHSEFGVPDALYTDMPEELLIGSVVDGHPYRSPLEEEQQTAAPLEDEGAPGEPLPQVPAPAPVLPATPHSTATAPPTPAGGPVCDVCGRSFKSRAGLESHRRAVHPDGGA